MVCRCQIRYLGPLGAAGGASGGDWYARNMYIPGTRQYEHHLKHYGHPSETGFKDIIPLWKAEKFDPDALMQLYVKAGARYFVSMAVHHDNFDLWDSRYQRWNAVKWGQNGILWANGKRRRTNINCRLEYLNI